jgi:hypothetical protein
MNFRTIPSADPYVVLRFSINARHIRLADEEEQKQGLRDLAGDGLHLWYSTGKDVLGRTGELNIKVGVHVDDPAGSWTHVAVELEDDDRPRERQPDNWQAVLGRVDAMLGPTAEWDCMVRLIMPKASVATAVDLPIGLDDTSTGFAEIRGVRLVQPDTTAARAELYSVVLDQFHESTSVTATFAGIFRFNEGLLADVFERGMEIIRLAAKPENRNKTDE